MKKFLIYTMLFAVSILLAACGKKSNVQTPTRVESSQTSASESSSTQGSSSQTSSTSATAQSAATELDGKYILQEADEEKTLTITNGTGTLESRSAEDGEVDTKQVTVNAADKTVTIGEEIKTYSLEGNILTLTESDGDVDTYIKQ